MRVKLHTVFGSKDFLEEYKCPICKRVIILTYHDKSVPEWVYKCCGRTYYATISQMKVEVYEDK